MSRYVMISTISISPISAYEKNLPQGVTMTDRVLELLDDYMARSRRHRKQYLE